MYGRAASWLPLVTIWIRLKSLGGSKSYISRSRTFLSPLLALSMAPFCSTSCPSLDCARSNSSLWISNTRTIICSSKPSFLRFGNTCQDISFKHSRKVQKAISRKSHFHYHIRAEIPPDQEDFYSSNSSYDLGNSTAQKNVQSPSNPLGQGNQTEREAYQKAETKTQDQGVKPRKEETKQIQIPIPGLRETVWGQQDLQPRYPKLSEDMRTDVVVVGGGIAGVSIAYNLARKGKSVVLLEGRVIGGGQTGRSTAHLMLWNDDYYNLIEKEFGREKTYILGDSHRKCIDWIEKTVAEENIDCGFRRLDGYLFPHDESKMTMNMLLEEFEASKRAGFTDISLVDLEGDPSLGSIHTAIKFPNSADINPLRYVRGLAEAFERNGGMIFEQSRVMKQERNTVITSDRKRVSADAVVLATNSPIHHNLAVHARQPVDRTYVVGLRVNKGDIQRANWWDTYTPYHYVRLEELDDYDVLIVGGSDHSTGAIKPNEYPPAYYNLEKWAKERWTPAKEVVYRWTGQVYKPIDSIGLYSHDPLNTMSNTYIATGDSGQGITGGTIAGIIISDLIAGRKNSWASIYDANRLPPPNQTTAMGVSIIAQHNVQGYLGRLPLYGANYLSIESLSPGEGAIIQQGLEKWAVHKDENGIARTFSAICPHLKCVVSWNPKDSTFDCQCHGSQFETQGRCIQGPAKANLFPRD